MESASVDQFLLSEDDLEESLFGEEPSAAFDPLFLSGDESGRVLVDLTNMLTHGSHPETTDHASALFTSAAGSVVFHHVTRFEGGAAHKVFEEFTQALDTCDSYRIELNDGAQFDVSKTGLEQFEAGRGTGVVARWLTTSEPFRIKGSWAITLKGDILSYVNARFPDPNEIHRLAKVALDRIPDEATS